MKGQQPTTEQMPDSTDIKMGQAPTFRSFSDLDWERWIWERAHGTDTLTSIPLIRDPNPHFAVVDAYRSLSNDKCRKLVIEALAGCLHREIEVCNCSSKQQDVFEDELLGLQRILEILNRMDIEDVERIRLRQVVNRACRAVYDFVHGSCANEEHPILRRLVLAVRSQFRDRILRTEIEESLDSDATFVVAFQHSVEQFSVAAVSDYFRRFVQTALRINKPQAVKMELARLKDRYASDVFSTAKLMEYLAKAVSALPQEECEVIKEMAGALGLEILETKPVKAAIQMRKLDKHALPVMYVPSEIYVSGKQYRTFVDAVIRHLCESNHARRDERGYIPWDDLASYLVLNYFDFCAAPYFRTGPRGHLINVIPIGTGKTFTCVLDSTCHWQFADWPLVDRGLSFKKRLTRTIDRVRVGDLRQRLTVGVLNCTAAAAEVVLALSDHAYPEDEAKTILFTGTSIEHLRHWLDQNREHAFVICDHGVAHDLIKMQPQTLGEYGYPVLPQSSPPRYISGKPETPDNPPLVFDFLSALSAGFMYPRDDAEWCKEIAQAIQKVIMQTNNFGSMWRDITEELTTLGIQAISYNKLCKIVGLEMVNTARKQEVVYEHEESAAEMKVREKP